ncbi:MAG: GNAT family N-acetyltransferase [Alphaproteobacteria bacterium]|jgi:ribosomal protein S18 acetylase RimI-like enzyme|nr:GNAT family N-acetyltransferase [Alphaproteobacteria bacterium]MBP9876910.1 GNAT family N-acetyltransferase [Alphaproteobacteria bacterium]
MSQHDLTLSFEKLTAHHAILLAELHPLIFKYQTWAQKDFETLFALSTIEGILLRSPEQPIGYLIWQNTPNESEIITFGIIPSAQKRGYGQILYDHYEGSRFLEHCHKILLEVSSTNKQAIRFYEKNSFVTTSIRKNYYNELGRKVDAILMMKAL